MFDKFVQNFYFSDQNQIFDLKVDKHEGGHVHQGYLKSETDWFPVIEGVPCFLRGDLRPDHTEFAKFYGLEKDISNDFDKQRQEQAATTPTFSAKWAEIPEYGLDNSSAAFLREWYSKKFGLNSVAELDEFYKKYDNILELGPGSGFNVRYMAERTKGNVFACDISYGAYATYKNTNHLDNVCVIQADLNDTPFKDNYFDFIIADGVLHHTPDTRKSLMALWEKLAPGGQIFFYVYRKMGAARQFCDQYIRENFSKLSPDECMKACEAITDLGKQLSDLNAKITLSKPIDVLNIPAGEHDVQRLIYYNFLKCFWNDSFDAKTNNIINYDWYHPTSAHQHTYDEVSGWLDELDAASFQFNDANPNGISCLACKK